MIPTANARECTRIRKRLIGSKNKLELQPGGIPRSAEHRSARSPRTMQLDLARLAWIGADSLGLWGAHGLGARPSPAAATCERSGPVACLRSADSQQPAGRI
jgi:hypothetical protein